MAYDNDLIAGKLRRWEKYLERYRLPAWEEIPDFGLYMEQVVQLLKQYLSYLPPELKQSQTITAAAINNYVRTKMLPEPRKKKYYRIHIAYLLMICTLKQSLSLSMLQTLLPGDLPEDEVRRAYTAYALRHKLCAQYFVDQVKLSAAAMLEPDMVTELAVQDMLYDPQTSGGLLIAAAPEDADALLRELRGAVPSAQRIGVVEAYNGGPRISLR